MTIGCLKPHVPGVHKVKIEMTFNTLAQTIKTVLKNEESFNERDAEAFSTRRVRDTKVTIEKDLNDNNLTRIRATVQTPSKSLRV